MKFQVGDRVRVYGGTAPNIPPKAFFNGCDGDVVEVDESHECPTATISIYDQGDEKSYRYVVHQRQLRKLVKKKRREWWITRGPCGEPMCTRNPCIVDTLHTDAPIPARGSFETIKVREVKK